MRCLKIQYNGSLNMGDFIQLTIINIKYRKLRSLGDKVDQNDVLKSDLNRDMINFKDKDDLQAIIRSSTLLI